MVSNAISNLKFQSQRNEPIRTASPIYDSDNENDFSFDLEAENSNPSTRNEMATPRRTASKSPKNSQRKVHKYRIVELV